VEVIMETKALVAEPREALKNVVDVLDEYCEEDVIHDAQRCEKELQKWIREQLLQILVSM
jgi:hypothetical protein